MLSNFPSVQAEQVTCHDHVIVVFFRQEETRVIFLLCSSVILLNFSLYSVFPHPFPTSLVPFINFIKPLVIHWKFIHKSTFLGTAVDSYQAQLLSFTQYRRKAVKYVRLKTRRNLWSCFTMFNNGLRVIIQNLTGILKL